jgi:hypothetical protein
MNWFDDNPVGATLGALCGVFVLSLIVIGVVWILPVGYRAPAGQGEGGSNAIELPVLADALPIENFLVVTERPLFSETRQPVIDVETDEDALAGDLADDQVETPEMLLTGVVITPSLRMATLRPADNDESLVAFEGQPLRGNYGSWQVTRIEPREVMMKSGRGEELQLSLQVHDAVIEAPPAPVPDTADEEANAESDELQAANDDEEPMTRAEEIRQRIAERREELKRAAEEGGQAPSISYQDAINSMVKKGARTREDQEQ